MLRNLARMTMSTTGNGSPITLLAAVPGFLTFAQAGVVDGETVPYGIIDGTSSECGTGVYTASGTTLATTPTKSTNSDARITRTAAAIVSITPRAEDCVPYGDGRFEYNAATSCRFIPRGGNLIKVNGLIHTIPNGGIAGLGNTGVYVSGTAGQNLAANSVYRVFVRNLSGVPTADFILAGTGNHMTSTTPANAGVEVYTSDGTTPDDTRTLIGLIATNASSQFFDSAASRGVRSWFNRPLISLFLWPASTRTTTSTAFVGTGDFMYWVMWIEERMQLQLSSLVQNTVVGTNFLGINIDGGFYGGAQTYCANSNLPETMTAVASASALAENLLHAAEIRFGTSGSGTQSLAGGGTGYTTFTGIGG